MPMSAKSVRTIQQVLGYFIQARKKQLANAATVTPELKLKISASMVAAQNALAEVSRQK